MKILICEDDHDITEIMKTILENTGHEVLTQDKCHDLENQISKEKPNLLIMDIWLAGENGKEIAIAIKKNRQTNRLPIIVISASTNVAETAREIGADAWLTKPFDIDEFLALVNKFEN